MVVELDRRAAELQQSNHLLQANDWIAVLVLLVPCGEKNLKGSDLGFKRRDVVCGIDAVEISLHCIGPRARAAGAPTRAVNPEEDGTDSAGFGHPSNHVSWSVAGSITVRKPPWMSRRSAALSRTPPMPSPSVSTKRRSSPNVGVQP